MNFDYHLRDLFRELLSDLQTYLAAQPDSPAKVVLIGSLTDLQGQVYG